MSNNSNNNVTSNVYNNTSTWRTTATMARDDEDEMEMLLHQSNNRTLGTEDTTINIENDMEPGTSQQHLLRQQLLQQIRRDGSGGSVNATRNNMGTNTGAVIGLGAAGHAATNGNASENTNTEEGQRIRNILSMFREARHQLHRSQSVRDPQQHAIPATANGEPIPAANTHPRTWRENLYDVLASPVTPRSNVFRTFFTNPSSSSTTNVRYNSLPTNDLHIPQENFHFLLNRQNGMQDTDLQPANRNGLETQSSTSGLRLSRQSSRLTDDRSVGESVTSPPQTPAEMPLDNGAAVNGGSRRQSNATTTSNGGGGGGAGGRVPPQRQTSGTGSTAAPTIEMDDADTNAVGELIVKLVSHFVRYLPFIFILFVKFIHDHLLGILDLILLHGIMYQINKSLKEQIAKLTQKSYGALIRDMVLVVCVISYRFLLATSTPDPFGLLINPPGATITLDLLTSQKSEEYEGPSDALNRIFAAKNLDDVPSSSPTKNPLNSTISVTKTLSLGVLLYYVAVNDLILKLLTQLVKIIVTLMPTKVIRHKSRVSKFLIFISLTRV